MGSRQQDQVYLVEDHTPPVPGTHTRYWVTVYTDRDDARADAGEYASRNGQKGLRWVEHGPVLYGHSAAEPDGNELFRIVPLSVRTGRQT
ncbi:MAG TPA: hypothetical protein VHC18_06680 [Amycolatopsis sp.]|nr:hypothetical protein [Amycolatopsis sp.]